MARLLNADYWKKSYLLEFKIDNVVMDAFTFSVPPESEEFVFPQRRNETKTFGGAVITDYGNDLVQINLSGSTINQELKLIYKSNFGYSQMTGEEEAFYLRDLLRKYGTREYLQGKEVTLYSLNGGGSYVKNNPKWWKISVGDLQISRDKSKPFCYNYKFSALGYPEILPISKKLSSIGNLIADWKTGMDTFTTVMYQSISELEENGANFLYDLSNLISTTKSYLDTFIGAIDEYTEIANGFYNQIGSIPLDTVMLGDKVLYSAFRYYPYKMAELVNTCKNVVKSYEKIYDYCNNIDNKYFSESAWQSIKELFNDTASNEDIADAYGTIAHNGENAANQAQALTMKYINNLGYAVIPGDTGEDDIAILTYGYKVVSVTDAETNWDQLAQDYYGDSSLSYVIATYNNLPIDKPLEAGQSILIPKLNFADSRILDNEVYNSPDVKDNYGNDVKIKNSDFGIYNGDIQTIGGIENLEQALLNRYSTLIGARIRLEIYGIQAAIGDALKASSSLIQASVHQTTVEDPRVESVENIDFAGVGDQLTVSVTYVDKNGNKQNFGGTV